MKYHCVLLYNQSISQRKKVENWKVNFERYGGGHHNGGGKRDKNNQNILSIYANIRKLISLVDIINML